MSTLKSLAETIGMGFSPRNSKTKTRLGLHHFVAATTDQMLMTRGGYGAGTPILSSCIHGSVGECNRFPCNLIDYSGGIGTNQTARLLGFANWAANNGIDLDGEAMKKFGQGISFLAKLRNLNPFTFLLQSEKLGSGSRYVRVGDSIIDRFTGKKYPKNGNWGLPSSN